MNFLGDAVGIKVFDFASIGERFSSAAVFDLVFFEDRDCVRVFSRPIDDRIFQIQRQHPWVLPCDPRKNAIFELDQKIQIDRPEDRELSFMPKMHQFYIFRRLAAT